MVSTLKKSVARHTAAWLRRNSRQVSSPGRRAGPRPCRRSRSRMVVAENLHPEAEEFTVDALVAPPRVVACEREDEVSDLGIDGGTARVAVRVGPMPGDEATMPTQQHRRCHDKRSPTTPVQNLAGGGEEATIRRLKLEAADPTTKNLDLMAQHHKFQVLGALRPAPQHQQSKDAPQRQVDERPDQFPPPKLGGETLRRQRRATDMPRTTRIRFPHPTGRRAWRRCPRHRRP